MHKNVGVMSRYRSAAFRCGHKDIDVDIMSTSGMTYIQMLSISAEFAMSF